jgi:hypothetical protein
MGLFNKTYSVNIRTKNHILVSKFKNDMAHKIVGLVEMREVTHSKPNKNSTAKRIITIDEDLKIPIGNDIEIFLFEGTYLAIHTD